MNTSNECIVSCLNKGAIFCPTLDMTSGYCCSTGEPNCPMLYGACTSDVSVATMKLFMCPFESFCGSSYLIESSSSLQTISYTGNSFTIQDLCHYQITFPDYALPGDTIVIKLTKKKKLTFSLFDNPTLLTYGKLYVMG
jgi:hypothetical protein